MITTYATRLGATAMSTFSALPIVILGASFGGISAVHHIYNQALKELQAADPQFTYRIILISPSTHLYWNIAAPRAIVSEELVPHSQNFKPIARGFERYDPSIFEFIQGTVTRVNTRAATVTLLLSGDASTAQGGRASIDQRRMSYFSATSRQSHRTSRSQDSYGLPTTTEHVVKYHSLIIATGTTSHSDLFSLRGPHSETQKALDTFHAKLPTAQTVVIAGGGASGVETAGQIAYYYNVRRCVPQARRLSHADKVCSVAGRLSKKRIIMYTLSSRLLPSLKPAHGAKAKAQLESMGVEVYTNMRVTRSTYSSTTGFTTLNITQNADAVGNASVNPVDSTLVTDLYIPCTGVSPNTSFLPDALLDMNGYLRTTRDHDGNSTLRVPLPGHLKPRTGRNRNRDSAVSTMSGVPSSNTPNKRLSLLSHLSTGSNDSGRATHIVELQRHGTIVPASPFQVDFADSSMKSTPIVSQPAIVPRLLTTIPATATSTTAPTTPHSPFSFVAPTTASLLGPSNPIEETILSTGATRGSHPDGTTPVDPLLALHPRIYAIGDVADYSEDCIRDVYAAMPVLEQNFIIDHLAWQVRVASGLALNEDLDSVDGSNDETKLEKETRVQLRRDLTHLAASSMSYKRDARLSILIPIGGHVPRTSRLPEFLARPRWFLSALVTGRWRPGGVGVIGDRKVPSFIVWLLKGRTYMVGEAGRVIQQGVSPYPYQEGERRAGVAGGGKAGWV